jgi:hypothetical protein
MRTEQRYNAMMLKSPSFKAEGAGASISAHIQVLKKDEDPFGMIDDMEKAEMLHPDTISALRAKLSKVMVRL